MFVILSQTFKFYWLFFFLKKKSRVRENLELEQDFFYLFFIQDKIVYYCVSKLEVYQQLFLRTSQGSLKFPSPQRGGSPDSTSPSRGCWGHYPVLEMSPNGEVPRSLAIFLNVFTKSHIRPDLVSYCCGRADLQIN